MVGIVKNTYFCHLPIYKYQSNKKEQINSTLFVYRVANRKTWQTFLMDYLVN